MAFWMLGFSLLCLDDDELPESGEMGRAWISILSTTPHQYTTTKLKEQESDEWNLRLKLPSYCSCHCYQQLYCYVLLRTHTS